MRNVMIHQSGVSQRLISRTEFCSVFVYNARKPIEFSILRTVNVHMAASVFLHCAMIPSRHYAYVFLSMEKVKALRRISLVWR